MRAFSSSQRHVSRSRTQRRAASGRNHRRQPCGNRHRTLPQVRMHPVHLSQLYLNLIGNAIKHRGDAAPRISLQAEARGDDWVYSVADNGIGIAPAYRQQIFGLFMRMHIAARYSDTGIGLAICHRIVERHEGRTCVESDEGKGSTSREHRHFRAAASPIALSVTSAHRAHVNC